MFVYSGVSVSGDMSRVPVVADLPAQLAVLKEQLGQQAAQYRVAASKLNDARVRERKLREALEESQRALAEVTALFTDCGIGLLWARTPYIPAETIAGYRRTAAQQPPLPGK